MVQAFRRARCEDTGQRFRLRGLDPEAAYEFTDFDKEGTVRLAGRALMKEGLPVTLPDPRSAAIIAYKRIDR
jgi:hypothetical protein